MATDLVVRRERDTQYSLQETVQLGEVLARSGFFADSKDAAQCVTKILAGRELGIGPVASMTGIYIVKGRVTLSANVMAAQIKRSGRYNYRVTRMDDDGCSIDFYEQGEPVGTSTFDKGDAQAAGLLGGDNWKKFPRNMYFSRAMSNGAKWFCPDVFSGPVYTPDELQDVHTSVDTVTGEIVEPINVTPVSEAPHLLHRIDEVLRGQGLSEAKRVDYVAKLKERHGAGLTDLILQQTIQKLEAAAAAKKSAQKAVEEVFDAKPIFGSSSPTQPATNNPGAKNEPSLWRETLRAHWDQFMALAFEDDSLETVGLCNRLDAAVDDLTTSAGVGHGLVEEMLRYIERHKGK